MKQKTKRASMRRELSPANVEAFVASIANAIKETYRPKRTLLTAVLPLETQTESNAKGHWRPKAVRAARQRSVARLVMNPLVARVRAGLAKGSVAGVSVTMTRISPRELDDDNLSSACKHVRDGIADALGIDDRDKRVRWLYAQIKGGKLERSVRVEVAT